MLIDSFGTLPHRAVYLPVFRKGMVKSTAAVNDKKDIHSQYKNISDGYSYWNEGVLTFSVIADTQIPQCQICFLPIKKAIHSSIRSYEFEF